MTKESKEIAELFNQICGQKLSKVIVSLLSDTRCKNIRLRNADLQRVGMSFEDYFNKVASSDFLCGKNSRGWKADFDWLLKRSSFIKVIEGNYDNKKSSDKIRAKATYDLERIKADAMNNTDI